MTEFLSFALLALGTAAAYTLAAQGIVLIYRGSGVVNFASGAIAFWGAWIYVHVRDGGAPAPAAALVAVAAGFAFGLAFCWLVMNRLQSASPLARLIATLGLLSTLQAAGQLVQGDQLQTVSSLLPTGPVDLGVATVGADRLLLLAIAVLLTVALHVVYRRTRFGLATSAVAEDEVSAAALGWSPSAIAALNWGVGCALAAASGALVVSITGLNVQNITLLVIPALAAALVGGFGSFPATLAGATAIAIAESETGHYVTTVGVAKSVPFLVIIGVLVARGQALPIRGHLADRLPMLGSGRVRPLPLALGIAALVALVSWVLTGSWLDAMTTTAVTAVICLSLTVVTGYAGQLSLAQFALAGIGAWIASRLAATAGLPFLPALIAGVLGTVPVGLLVGLPSLRTRGVNLAIATLGFALVAESVVFDNPSLTGGVLGTTLPSPTLLGFSIDPIAHPQRYALVAIAALVLAGVVVANLRRSRTGRRLIAVRANERAAAALGVDVMRAKLFAFGLSAAIAGLGGVILAFSNASVVFSDFNLFASINVVVYAVIGGIGFVSGPLAGAPLAPGGLATALSSEIFTGTSIETILLLLGGLLLVTMLLVHPDGLARANAASAEQVAALARRVRRRRAAPPPAPALAAVEPPSIAPRALEVRDLSVSFGGVRALRSVSLRVEPGQVVGLIGPNGAGKTTLIDAVTGFAPATGEVLMDGAPLRKRSPHRCVGAGVARSFQSLELFDDLTVRDNLRLGAAEQRRLGALRDLVRPDGQPLSAGALAAVRHFGLAEVLDLHPSALSFGQRRLVALARTVACAPSVVLLDEPAAGLDVTARRGLGELIRLLASEWGMGVLVVEHDVELVMRSCDHVVVLDAGAVIEAGSPEQVRRSAVVAEAYLGTPAVTEPTTGGVR